MGLLSLKYTRPPYVEKDAVSQTSSSGSSLKKDSQDLSERPSSQQGVPDALAFDKIINGGTCPVSTFDQSKNTPELTHLHQPCTVRDFMNYLKYIELSAENLQFYLWYQDYVKRFTDAKTSETALAPEWTRAMQEEAISKIQKENTEKLKAPANSEVAEIFKGTDFDAKPALAAPIVTTPLSPYPLSEPDSANPFGTPPRTPANRSSTLISESVAPSNAASFREHASDAFAAIGAKQPCKSKSPLSMASPRSKPVRN